MDPSRESGVINDGENVVNEEISAKDAEVNAKVENGLKPVPTIETRTHSNDEISRSWASECEDEDEDDSEKGSISSEENNEGEVYMKMENTSRINFLTEEIRNVVTSTMEKKLDVFREEIAESIKMDRQTTIDLVTKSMMHLLEPKFQQVNSNAKMIEEHQQWLATLEKKEELLSNHVDDMPKQMEALIKKNMSESSASDVKLIAVTEECISESKKLQQKTEKNQANINRMSEKMYQLEVKSTNMAQRIKQVGVKEDYEVLISNNQEMKGEIRNINSQLSKRDAVIEEIEERNIALHKLRDVYIEDLRGEVYALREAVTEQQRSCIKQSEPTQTRKNEEEEVREKMSGTVQKFFNYFKDPDSDPKKGLRWLETEPKSVLEAIAQEIKYREEKVVSEEEAEVPVTRRNETGEISIPGVKLPIAYVNNEDASKKKNNNEVVFAGTKGTWEQFKEQLLVWIEARSDQLIETEIEKILEVRGVEEGRDKTLKLLTRQMMLKMMEYLQAHIKQSVLETVFKENKQRDPLLILVKLEENYGAEAAMDSNEENIEIAMSTYEQYKKMKGNKNKSVMDWLEATNTARAKIEDAENEEKISKSVIKNNLIKGLRVESTGEVLEGYDTTIKKLSTSKKLTIDEMETEIRNMYKSLQKDEEWKKRANNEDKSKAKKKHNQSRSNPRGKTTTRNCYHCGKEGHIAMDCPEGSKSCARCGSEKHTTGNCEKNRKEQYRNKKEKKSNQAKNSTSMTLGEDMIKEYVANAIRAELGKEKGSDKEATEPQKGTTFKMYKSAYTTYTMQSYNVEEQKKNDEDDWIYLDSMSNVNICGPEHMPIILESYSENDNGPCINGVGEMQQDVVATGIIRRILKDSKGSDIMYQTENVKVVEGMDRILNSLGRMLEYGWKCDMLNMMLCTPGGEQIPMEFHECFLRIKCRNLNAREEAEMERKTARKQK